MSDVKLKFRRFGLRPPPFTDLLFDMEVENTEDRCLWILLPLYMAQSAEFGPFSASAVEISEWIGQGKVRIAQFLGDGSFQMMRLPPGARVSIREFPITYVGDPPQREMLVPVILAEQVRIGEQNAEDWLSLDLSSTPDACVAAEPGAVVASQDTPGARPVSIATSSIKPIELCVQL
jgi:hypothetical protein